jgi:hypothetical protein
MMNFQRRNRLAELGRAARRRTLIQAAFADDRPETAPASPHEPSAPPRPPGPSARQSPLSVLRRLPGAKARRALVVLLAAGLASAGAGAIAAAVFAGVDAAPSSVAATAPAPAAQTGSPSAPGSPAVAAPATPPITFGGELRVRGEALDNATDLYDGTEDGYQFTRMRYRFWADAKPREGLRVYFRLGNEYRWGQWGNLGTPSIRDAESRVSVDNAWAEIAWPPASGLTWKFGRMDLSYGDGFLVFDGTPADGSSSGFFDGVRARYKRGPVEADLFSMKLVDRGFATTARDEDFHGLYFKRSEVEIYALHRFKHQASVYQSGKPWQVTEPRQRTLAVGSRLAHLPETGWQGAAEWAFQFGRYYDSDGNLLDLPGEHVTRFDRSAHGVQLRGGRTWAVPAKPAFEIGGIHLSGDDPTTREYEGWDDFYGEWPKYSELLIYTVFDGTTRVQRLGGKALGYTDDAGAWTNLAAGWLEGRVTPYAGLRVTARGTMLRAVEATGPGIGKDRGLLLAAKADYTGIPGVAVQALGEWFDPGDFYSERADQAWYGRFQVTTGF